MSTIPRNFIDDLLNRIDIVDLIESYVKLKRQGRNFVACCPFHDEKTPSFSVSQEKQIFHCFGCGVGGNAISFLMDYDHLHFVEAIEELARRVGVSVPREQQSPQAHAQKSPDDYQALMVATQYYQQQLKNHPKAEAAKDYLKSRGLSGQTAKQFALGFAPPGWDNLLKSCRQADIIQSWKKTGLITQKEPHKIYDKFRNRIMYPIRNRRGQVIGFGGRIIDPNDNPKYLNSNESAVFHKSQTLYGLYEMLQHKRRFDNILIVEGYMDVIMLAEHGIHNAVATLGTATTPEHIQILLRLSNKITFCFDGDSAGQSAAWRALESCLKKLRNDSDIRFLFLPEGEDPDSIVGKEGHDRFCQRVDKAIGLPEYLIRYLTHKYDQHSMAGKSALLSTASQLLNNMPNIHLKDIIMEELANSLHLTLDRLPKLMQQSQKHAKTTLSDELNNIPPILRRALALLTQQPHLIEYVPEVMVIPTDPSWKIWQKLTKFLRATPTGNTASLLEYWREHDDYNLLLQLANWQYPLPLDGIKKEFCALMTHIQTRDHYRELEDLLHQAKIRELSQAERQRLAQLIQEKQAKKREKNS